VGAMRTRGLMLVVHASVLLAIVAGVPLVSVEDPDFPVGPFTRALSSQSPMLRGNDVLIAQTLLARSPFVVGLEADGVFGAKSADAVSSFQKGNGLPVDGTLTAATAGVLLDKHSADGFVDDGQSAESQGYLYKIIVPLHSNRSVEVMAELLAANNTVLHRFRVRGHGEDTGPVKPWPVFNNTNPGRSEFASSGNTPTGLSEVDLNTPEEDPHLYGPYPINRVTTGLVGNAKLLMPGIRTGILLHTGEWPGWTPDQDMPNSAGCIHAHPTDIDTIAKILSAEGVEIRKNPDHGGAYPYKPQGLIAVQLVD